MRTVRSKARTAISSRRSRTRCCCADRATSTTYWPIAALSTRSSAPQCPQPQAARSRALGLAIAATAPDDGLRGDHRHRYLDQRVHPQEGVLFVTVAPDRPPAARAALRRPPRMLPRLDAADDAAPRVASFQRKAWPRHQLPARHPCLAPQANGLAQSGLS